MAFKIRFAVQNAATQRLAMLLASMPPAMREACVIQALVDHQDRIETLADPTALDVQAMNAMLGKRSEPLERHTFESEDDVVQDDARALAEQRFGNLPDFTDPNDTSDTAEGAKTQRNDDDDPLARLSEVFPEDEQKQPRPSPPGKEKGKGKGLFRRF